MKRDYEGFVRHIWEWNINGRPYGIADMIVLSKHYNTPIPDEILPDEIKKRRGLR